MPVFSSAFEQQVMHILRENAISYTLSIIRKETLLLYSFLSLSFKYILGTQENLKTPNAFSSLNA